MPVINCDICIENNIKKSAIYDCKLLIHGGAWAYVCNEHYMIHGCKVKGLFTELKQSK
jgi:hypothetical protein